MNSDVFQKIKPGTKDFSKLSIPLRALLIDYNGDWDRAHSLVQNESTTEAAWVHAYLHRKEGDDANANYWYSNAGRYFSTSSLEIEWEEIAITLLRN